MTDVIETACQRFPSDGQIAKTARIRDLIAAQAWTDAPLALIDFERSFAHRFYHKYETTSACNFARWGLMTHL
jgi:hypothetical protein